MHTLQIFNYKTQIKDMKKLTFLTFFVLVSLVSWGQIITSTPAFVTNDYNDVITIVYDATKGTAGLKDYTGTDGVYAHTGVITNQSTSSSDWKHAPTWGDNAAKYKLTSLGNNKWQLLITPNMTSYYGLTTGEIVQKMAFVFRNGLKTKEGKDVGGTDIFLPVYAAGLNVGITTPSNKLTTLNTSEPVEMVSSVPADLELFVNGSSVKTVSSATSLSYQITYNQEIDYTLIAKATVSGTSVYDTAYVCVPAPVTNQARPSGTLAGINYVDNNTVTLVLQAPNKTRAFVIGEMNDWATKNAYQMKKDGEYFWLTLTGLTPGKIYGYQYQVDDDIKISDPYTEMVLDPWSDQWINKTSTIYPNLKPYPTNKTTGIVATFQTAKPIYSWTTPSITVPPKDNMVIYELLFRDFTQEKTIEAAITKLDYLKNLGVTAVEVMPITEFDGNESWGYNPNHYFAADKAYGPPSSYKKFVDECHQRGIAVIVDMVFNHATGNSPFAGLYWDRVNNRPAANSPYMNPVAPHDFSVFNDFNHSNATVREHFKRVLQYWINEYKVDGFRFDLSKGFTQGAGTSYDANRVSYITEYQDAVKAAKADAMFILEHWGPSDEESYIATKGMYMWMNNVYGYQQSAMGVSSGSSLAGMVRTPRQWIGYAESHDEERTFYKAKAFGSGIIASDSIKRVARVPLNLAFEVLIPGPKMLWQFQELGYDYSIDANGGRTNNKPPAWGWLNLTHRKSAYDKCAKIINLRKSYPNAFIQGNFGYNISETDWSAGRRLIITHSDLNMIALGNFQASSTITAYPNFPKTGTWYELLTGEELNVTNTNMTIQLSGGDVKIYTDRIIPSTDLKHQETVLDCKIYPTVVDDLINIVTPSEVKQVRIFNTQGAFLHNEANKNIINVSQLKAGMYLMEITTEQGKAVLKFVKQ